jgi:hypothetical protein
MTPATTFPGAREYSRPKRIVFEPGTYTGLAVNSLGTVLRTRPATLQNSSGASAARRARLPGRPGYWFYVVDGIWEGYWIRDTARVEFES